MEVRKPWAYPLKLHLQVGKLDASCAQSLAQEEDNTLAHSHNISFFYHCRGLQAGWDREWRADPIPAGYGGVSHAVEEGYLGRGEITITKRRGTETVPGTETDECRRIHIACARKSRGRVMPGWGML